MTRSVFNFIVTVLMVCCCTMVPSAEDTTRVITPKQIVLSINGVSLGMSKEEVSRLIEDVEAFPDKIGQKMSAPQSWHSPRVNFDKEARASLVVGNLLSLEQNTSIKSGQGARELLSIIGSPEIKKPIGLTLEIWEYSSLKLTVHVYRDTETIEWFTLASDI